MNFSSLREYFYRLYNTCLSRLLVTMGFYLLIYYLLLTGVVTPYIQELGLVDFLRFTFLTLIVVALTIVHLVTLRQLKVYSSTVGLGDKLDLYYSVVKLKARAMVVISLFSAAGLFFTGHQWFSIYYAGMMIWLVLQWPTPRKVSRHLKLRGDERQMVITKGDAFTF